MENLIEPEVGVRNRFYANSWLAFEHSIGVFKILEHLRAYLIKGVAYIF